MIHCSFCGSPSSDKNGVLVNEGNVGKHGVSICKRCMKLAAERLEGTSESEDKVISLFNDEPPLRLA